MTEDLVFTEASGTIAVPAATLTRIVVRAAELVDGARVRRPRRGVEVEVEGAGAAVLLQVVAPYGAVLPDLAEAVQAEVARALEQMCGVDVRRVDVAIEELVDR
jgi:Asp23 family, cell envelope-related function